MSLLRRSWKVQSALAVAAGSIAGTIAKVEGVSQEWLIALAAISVVAAIVPPVLAGLQEREETTRRLEDLLVHHPPRRVSAIFPSDVGAGRSELAEADGRGRRAPYIERDVDEELQAAIARSDFVVLTGAAKEGKSRTAFHAIEALDGDPYLLAVRGGASPDQVIEQRPWEGLDGQVVLWLDEIDGFLHGGKFTRASAERFLGEAPDALIVGTITDSALDAILSVTDADGYEPRQVLAEAVTMRLAGVSESERERGRALYGADESFALGIGQHFVGAEELRRRYNGADLDVKALLRAGADWQRTGMPRPISRNELETLYLAYLDDAGASHDLGPSVEWAGKRVSSGGQLLERRDQDGARGFRVPDHVIEYITAADGNIRSAAWSLAIKGSKAREALAIGDRARERRERAIATEAFQRAFKRARKMPRTRTTAAARCAIMLRALKRHDEAMPYLEAAVAGGNRHSAFLLFDALADGRRLDESDALFLAGVEQGNRAAALLLGNIVHQRGELGRADELYTAAQDGPLQIDGRFTPRALMLRACIAEARDDHATADELFAAGWDVEEWRLTKERLDQVGLDLTDCIAGLAQRAGVE